MKASSEYASDQLRPLELQVPDEATHLHELGQVFEQLNDSGVAVIVGPSRAGKTTFLKHTLSDALVSSGFQPLYVNGFQVEPESTLDELTVSPSVVIVDETRELIHAPGFAQAIRNRRDNGHLTILGTTYFASHLPTQAEFEAFMGEIGAGSSVIEFPMTMTQEDAIKIVEAALPGRSSAEQFASELGKLTTQPCLLDSIIRTARRGDELAQGNELKVLVRTMLEGMFLEDSLRPCARELWSRVTSEPLPSFLIDSPAGD